MLAGACVEVISCKAVWKSISSFHRFPLQQLLWVWKCKTSRLFVCQTLATASFESKETVAKARPNRHLAHVTACPIRPAIKGRLFIMVQSSYMSLYCCCFHYFLLILGFYVIDLILSFVINADTYWKYVCTLTEAIKWAKSRCAVGPCTAWETISETVCLRIDHLSSFVDESWHIYWVSFRKWIRV